MAREGKKRRQRRTGPHCERCKVRSYRDGDMYRCPKCGVRFKLLPGGIREMIGLIRGPWENLGPGC